MSTKQKVAHLLWSDALLTVMPSTRQVEAFLRIKEKKIDEHNRQTKETVNIFQTILDTPERKVIETYQGFCEPVKGILEAKGHTVEVHDQRLPFPEPRYDLITGTRFGQKELLVKALQKNQSGIIVAPTRYGKTSIMINLLRCFPGIPWVVTAPGRDLVTQLYREIQAAFPHTNVVLLGAGSKCRFPSDFITVCSMDSLHKCDHGRVRGLAIDEIHAAVTDSRLPEFLKFGNARKFGVGATPEGRFDGRDRLITGLIGPVLSERTYLEGVAEGAIAPLMVYFLRVPFTPRRWRYRAQAYKALLFKNEDMAKLIARISEEVIPPNWQTLIFVKQSEQADMIKAAVPGDSTIAMAKVMTDKERKAVTAQMVEDKISRCLCSVIYSQGVTFSKARCLINAESGGAYTGTIQKPGRLAEIRPDIKDKKYGIIIDFSFVSDDPLHPFPKGDDQWGGLIFDSMARRKAYTAKGYEVVEVNSLDELKNHFYQTHIKPYEVTPS